MQSLLDKSLFSMDISILNLSWECIFIRLSQLAMIKNSQNDEMSRGPRGYYQSSKSKKDVESADIHKTLDSFCSIIGRSSGGKKFNLKFYFEISRMKTLCNLEDHELEDKLSTYYCCMKSKIAHMWQTMQAKYDNPSLGIKFVFDTQYVNKDNLNINDNMIYL